MRAILEHYDTVKCWYARCRIHPDRTTRLSSVSLLLRVISQLYGTIRALYGNDCIRDCGGGVALDIHAVWHRQVVSSYRAFVQQQHNSIWAFGIVHSCSSEILARCAVNGFSECTVTRSRMYQCSSNIGSAARQSIMCFVTYYSWQQVMVLPLLTCSGVGRLHWKCASFLCRKIGTFMF